MISLVASCLLAEPKGRHSVNCIVTIAKIEHRATIHLIYSATSNALYPYLRFTKLKFFFIKSNISCPQCPFSLYGPNHVSLTDIKRRGRNFLAYPTHLAFALPFPNEISNSASPRQRVLYMMYEHCFPMA